MHTKIALSLLFLIVMSGCSLQKFALKTTTGLFKYGIEALYEEPDLIIAEQAIASNLKLLDGFYIAEPRNKELLLMLTQGYASYSLGFVEDRSVERAQLFYLRARDYGLDLLRLTSAFKDSIPVKEADFLNRIARLKKEDVPALFWTAFAWAGWINLSKDNAQAIFDLGKVKGMMKRVQELDESFFFGSVHLFFGSIYGSLPKMLGGDPDKAKAEFDRCLEINQGKFLLTYVYLARYYAQPTLDEALFDKYLKIVLQAPEDVLPGYELITSIAKKKAQDLIIKKEDLF
jgi:hypothetical protein